MNLFYDDDPASDCRVEIFDKVECRIDGDTYDGVVTKVHPRNREVTVRYEDDGDRFRTTGNPRTKTARLHILEVDLIARDG